MAEIKSTLDIVLEKTKHLVLTAEEREALERQEHLEKVPGIVQRFLDGAWSVNQMREAWHHIPEPFREEARTHILHRLLGALSDEESVKKIIPAMEAFASEADAPYVRRLALIATPNPDSEHSWDIQRQRRLAALAERGIRGDAVHVTPDLDPTWQTSRAALVRAIDDVKTEWRAVLAPNVTGPLKG